MTFDADAKLIFEISVFNKLILNVESLKTGIWNRRIGYYLFFFRCYGSEIILLIKNFNNRTFEKSHWLVFLRRNDKSMAIDSYINLCINKSIRLKISFSYIR